MTKQQLPDKPAWQRFEQTNLDRQGFVDRFRRAEIKVSGHAHEFIAGRWRHLRQVRTPIIMWSILIVVILLATSLDLYFNQRRYYTDGVDEQSSYFEGVVGNLSTLNPLLAATEADKLAERLIFSRLYEHDQTGSLKGDLAKTAIVSDDGLTYTITMRDNAKWHDGHKLTAEDVKYTIDLFKNQAIGSFTGQVLRGVTSKVISEYTIEFNLRSRYAPFLQLLDFSILPKHILHGVDSSQWQELEFNQRPVGSGRFKVQSLKASTPGRETGVKTKQILALAYNEQYHQHANLKRFELHVYPELDQLVKALQNNEINAMATKLPLNQTVLDGLKTRFKIQTSPINSGVFAFFNLQRHNLGSVKVRQALRIVLAAEELRQLRFNQDGTYSEFDLPIMKRHLRGADTVYAVNHDLAGAERLLKEAGLTKKDGLWLKSDLRPLKLELVSIKGTQYQMAAEFIAKKLQQFGIEVDLKLVDPHQEDITATQDIFKNKKYDLLVYEIDLGADPDVYGFWHSSQANQFGLNFANYKNRLADEALATARLRPDLALRIAKYDIFLKHWLQDVPAVGLFQPNLYYISQKGVRGFQEQQVVNLEQRLFGVLDWSGGEKRVYKTP